jgi:hypothetical protein
MNRSRLLAFSFWLVLGFVTWNVVFDRQVAIAGAAFTREQTLNRQQGRPLRTIDDAFRPEVRAAARRASAWAGAVLATGALISLIFPPSSRSDRQRTSSRAR